MLFLESFLAAIVTAGVGFGLSLIPIKRDRNIHYRPEPRHYTFATFSAFSLAMIFDALLLATTLADFTDRRVLVLLYFNALIVAFVFWDADHRRNRWGWAPRVAIFVAVVSAILFMTLAAIHA